MSRRPHGFTLLELLVAITVFAILAGLAYSGLRVMIEARERIERSARQLEQMQRALLFLQQDIAQILPRGVRDALGDADEALALDRGEDRLLFTLGGAGSGLDGTRPGLRRVAYRLHDGRLQRVVWPVVDLVQSSEPRITDLVPEVREVGVRVFDDGWTTVWPKRRDGATKDALPLGIEISLRGDGFGTIRRVFAVSP